MLSESRRYIADVETGAPVIRGRFSFTFPLEVSEECHREMVNFAIIVVCKHRNTLLLLRPSLNSIANNPTPHAGNAWTIELCADRLPFFFSCVRDFDACVELPIDQVE